MHESSFPIALMAKLGDILQPIGTEVYTGQLALQSEVRSMLKLLTPINEANLKEVRRKVFKKAEPVEASKSVEHFNSRNRLANVGMMVVNKPTGLLSQMNRLF